MIANCDNQMIHMLEENNPVMAHALECDATVVSEEQKQFLKNLPPQKELEIEGVKILLYMAALEKTTKTSTGRFKNRRS